MPAICHSASINCIRPIYSATPFAQLTSARSTLPLQHQPSANSPACITVRTVSSASPTAQQIWYVQVGSLGFLAWHFLCSSLFLPRPWAVGIDAETNCHSASKNVNVLEVVAMVLVAAQNGLPILQRVFSKEADEWAERRDHVGLA
jgi:hypothetical protein